MLLGITVKKSIFFFSFTLIIISDSSTNNIHTDLSHHNTYSPEITTNRILNLSDSQSPAQQSFTSDISALDDISTQSKQKKTLPNFFRSNHDMEVSIKQALTTSLNNLLLIFLFIFSLFSDIKSCHNQFNTYRTNFSNKLNIYFVLIFYFKFR
jgi:hypothetical protein